MTIEPHLETEVKLRIEFAEPIRAQLEKMGMTLLQVRHHELNLVFDFPDHSLQRNGMLLRLRQAAGKCLLTLKSPFPGGSAAYKMRQEREVEVASLDSLKAIFLGIGLEIWFAYEKRREVYGGKDIAVMIDETPIGIYAELEGPPEAIDRLSRQLGFSRKDYITQSYFQLFRAKNPSGDMLFSA